MFKAGTKEQIKDWCEGLLRISANSFQPAQIKRTKIRAILKVRSIHLHSIADVKRQANSLKMDSGKMNSRWKWAASKIALAQKTNCQPGRPYVMNIHPVGLQNPLRFDKICIEVHWETVMWRHIMRARSLAHSTRLCMMPRPLNLA